MDSKTAIAAHEYKLLKEAFVSGLNGGSIWEINQVTLVAPASVLLWSVLQSQQSFFTPYTPLGALADFLLNCAAILFATTLYSAQPLLLNGLLVIPAVVVLVYSKLTPPPRASKAARERGNASLNKAAAERDAFPVKPFVTAYRGTMLVVTCVAILAVDFRVFPRRFAKVENWGTSLMDIGVGSFVFSAGTVAARPVLKQRKSGASYSLVARLRASVRHSTPLLVLGLIRLYSVKGLDYAEHVTEYGVHWNFFFTLGFIPPFVALFDSAFTLLPSYAALALLLGAAYELLLNFTDLKGYILTAPRTHLLSKNREGVFSLFGYLAIFLAGQATGMYILPRTPKTGLFRNPLLRRLILWSVVWCALASFTLSYDYGLNLQVSRRLANLPYFLWIAAFNTVQITLYCAIEVLCFPGLYHAKSKVQEQQSSTEASSRILRAFNRNGLAIFLLANLLTGLVNLTLPTLTMGNLEAVGVLLAYTAALTAVALLLDLYNVSLKL